jgi:hypothetical protein
MNREIDTRYLFHFLRPDGRRHTHQAYWEDLYLFTPGRRPLLGGVRVVPHHDLAFALYLALRDKGGNTPIHRELLPQLAADPEKTGGLVASVADLIPRDDTSTSLPAEVLRKGEELLEGAVDQLMADYAVETIAESGSLPNDVEAVGASLRKTAGRLSADTAGLGGLVYLSAEDVGLIHLSHLANRAIQEQLDRAGRELHSRQGEHALALREDLEFEMAKKLYTDPRYLEFVHQVMNARGGFISPLVRHFITFYCRCLREQIDALSQRDGAPPPFWEERLEAAVGRAEASAGQFLPYREVTLLGYLHAGDPRPDPEDPDPTRTSFKIDPGTRVEDLLLEEIDSAINRALAKRTARASLRYNIERVRFADEPRKN